MPCGGLKNEQTRGPQQAVVQPGFERAQKLLRPIAGEAKIDYADGAAGGVGKGLRQGIGVRQPQAEGE